MELVLVGAASAVLGGLLLESFRSRARRYWQTRQENRQEERLLREFLDMAWGHPDGTLAAHLSARTAAARARIRDPEAVLKRLLHKDHIRADTVFPNHFHLSFEGRQRAYDARRSFWQRITGR